MIFEEEVFGMVILKKMFLVNLIRKDILRFVKKGKKIIN